jgi:hypothetical protein
MRKPARAGAAHPALADWRWNARSTPSCAPAQPAVAQAAQALRRRGRQTTSRCSPPCANGRTSSDEDFTLPPCLASWRWPAARTDRPSPEHRGPADPRHRRPRPPAAPRRPSYPVAALLPRSSQPKPTRELGHAWQPPADLWDRIRRGFAMPNLESDLVRDQRAVVRHPARLHPAHDGPLAQVPVPHRRGTRAAQHADRAGAAALHRERVQPAGRVQRARRGHVAVHAGHRHATST